MSLRMGATTRVSRISMTGPKSRRRARSAGAVVRQNRSRFARARSLGRRSAKMMSVASRRRLTAMPRPGSLDAALEHRPDNEVDDVGEVGQEQDQKKEAAGAGEQTADGGVRGGPARDGSRRDHCGSG
jgi:hypothetical protein